MLPAAPPQPAAGAPWLVPLRIGIAGAACWHLLGNPLLADGWPALAVGLTAAAVALRPRSPLPFVALTVALWLSIWDEAPFLGNHWLLLGCLATACCLGGVRAVRVVALGFYAFAAFAKLNAGFFDPAVSCGTYYLAESARSLGVDLAPPAGVAGGLVVTAVALTELSVPVLLAVRRTRWIGVALAVTFHAVLAIDHQHQFYDFTSVLLAVFVTFLPDAAAGELRRIVTTRVPAARVRLGLAVLAAGAGALAGGDVDRDVPFELGYASWQLVAVVATPLVVRRAWRARAEGPPAGGALALPRLAIPVLALVVLNGMSPYLELKDSTSWNMYANLRTAGGESNHFVIRATLPLTGAYDDLVEVTAADGALRPYVGSGLVLPVRQLRWYLQSHPEESATITIDGGTPIEVVPGTIPAELGPPVPEAIGRLAAVRSVRPEGEPVRCQDVFFAAT